jgi:pyruvate decarboxylase
MGYVEIPVDTVTAPVASDRLRSDICLPEAVPNLAQEITWAKVLNKIYTAKQPLILFDGESRGLGIMDDVQSLVKLSKWPTWTTIFGTILVDESQPNVHGIY